MKQLLGWWLVCSALLVALPAPARPGGGQSYSTGSPSYGSYGSDTGSSSSYGSSDTGSSRGSSIFGSSDSSSSRGSSIFGGSDSPSSDPAPEPYRPTAPSGIDYDRQSYDLNCMQKCIGQSDYTSCLDNCKGSYTRPAAPKYKRRSGSAPAREEPLTGFLWIPGILLGVIGLGAGINRWKQKQDEKAWASIADDYELNAWEYQQRRASQRYPNITRALAVLRAKDDAFSWALFEDFLHALYVQTHTLRGGNRLHQLKSYLTPAAINVLHRGPADSVETIIVGAIQTQEILALSDSRRVEVRVAIDANYTETKASVSQSYYSHEVWTLSRSADVPSRPPERARTIGCTGCGAPLEKLVGEACEYCGAPSAAGAQDWQVDDIVVVAREPRGPQLTGTTEEKGTDLPTLVAPDIKGDYGALMVRDPAFSWNAFMQRVAMVFQEFHRSWTAQELSGVRPFLSDTLFETQRYWVDAYRAQGLRNISENPSLVSLTLSRLVHDKYYDALTVRVFASCQDYTVDAKGTVVGGSKDTVREYTEYWTFIRSVDAKGAPGTEPRCPHCGAPVTQINVAGECGSCHVKVTGGHYDWVLSRIEQDEVYRL